MRILDRYILKKTIFSYLFVLVNFIGLYLIVDIFSNLSDILKTKPPLNILIPYYFYMLPGVFKWVSPYSLLISVLYTLGELNKNNEIITMRTAGIGILRTSGPIVLFSLLISFFSLYMQEKIMISSQKKVENIKIQFIKKNFSFPPEENNLAFTSKDMVFFARKFLPEKEMLEDAIIFKEDGKGNIIKKMICKRVIYENEKWEGENVIEYTLDEKGRMAGEPLCWEKINVDLQEKPQELIFKRSIFYQFSSLKNLKKEIMRLEKIEARTLLSNLIIDYHAKIIEPFSHFFLVIGILPLALEIKKKRVALSSLGMGFLYGFIYYCLTSFSIALGKTGVILPYLAPWLSPLFLLTIGLTGLFLIK